MKAAAISSVTTWIASLSLRDALGAFAMTFSQTKFEITKRESLEENNKNAIKFSPIEVLLAVLVWMFVGVVGSMVLGVGMLRMAKLKKLVILSVVF